MLRPENEVRGTIDRMCIGRRSRSEAGEHILYCEINISWELKILHESWSFEWECFVRFTQIRRKTTTKPTEVRVYTSMGFATRVSFTHFLFDVEQSSRLGLVVVATIIIIMYRRSEVKTSSTISYEYTKMPTHSSEHLYIIFNSLTAKTDARRRLLRYMWA